MFRVRGDVTLAKRIKHQSNGLKLIWLTIFVVFLFLYLLANPRNVNATLAVAPSHSQSIENKDEELFFSKVETPTFVLDTSGKISSNSVTSFENEKDFGGGKKIKTELLFNNKITDQKLLVSPVTKNDNQFQIETESSNQFKPGKYQVKIVLSANGKDETLTQDFKWGVLALNLDKSSYKIGEKANIGIGVLDDLGKTVCDAKLELRIENKELGVEEIFSTENKNIVISKSCANGNITNIPDYLASYTPKIEGKYQIELKAETANGPRAMTDSFEVLPNSDFVINRFNTSMRIVPTSIYTVNIDVKAFKDLSGGIKEKVPASFAISNISGGGQIIDKNETIQTISWSAILNTGESIKLSYDYDAPDISPEFYLLGPLEVWQPTLDDPIADTGDVTTSEPKESTDFSITNNDIELGGNPTPETISASQVEETTVFTEPRPWQIASDVPDGTGMLVYDEDGANSPSPHYRTWDGTDLSAESNMQADETVTDEVNHTIIEASPTRDEYIRGALTTAGHLDVQVYTGGSWQNGGSAPTNGDFTTGIGTTNDVYRAFDISYEETTGDGMVVYESTSTANKTIMYRTWDGTNWSAEQTLDYTAVAEGGATDVTVWVELEGDYGSNNILLGWQDKAGLGFYGARWDGTQWLNIALISGAGVIATKQGFDVAWEGTSGKGKMVYATGTTIGASTYTPGSGWGADTVTSPIAVAIQWVRIAGSPNNNYIAVMANGPVSTSSADMYVDMWNGTNWTTVGTITGDSDINNNGYAQPMDVAWEKAASADRALFVWRDGTTSETSLRSMVYDISAGAYLAIDDNFFCDLTGTNVDQTVTSLASAEDSNGPCNGLGSGLSAWPTEVSGVKLTSDPGSRKIMVLGENLTADLKPEAQLWNGTDTGTWLNQTTNMGAIEADLSTGATLSVSLPTKAYDFAFRASTPIFTVSGGCFTNDGEGTPCTDGGAGDQIKVAVNGVLDAGSDGTVDGAWSFTLSGPASGAILTFFRDGAPTAAEKATTVIKYDGSGDVTNVKMYQSMLVIGADAGSANSDQTITNSDLDTTGNGYEYSDDTDVVYGVDTGILTVDQGANLTETLYIISGDTFQPDSAGGDTVTTHHLYIEGTFTTDNNTVNVSGDWTTAGTFTSGTSLIDFNASSGTQTLNSGGTGAGKVFYNLTHSGAGTLQLSTNAINVIGDFTNSAGTFDTNSLAQTYSGNFANSATFTAGTTTSTFNKATTTQTLNSGGIGTGKSFYNLTHSGAGTLQLVTNAIQIDGDFTNSTGTFDTNSLDQSIKGNFNNAGTFTAGSSTTNFIGTTSGKTISLGNSTLYNVTFNGSGGVWSPTSPSVININNYVMTVAIQDATHVYIGGQFTNVAGVTGRSYIAMWNGSAWSTVGAINDLNNFVQTITVQDATHVYVGGNFTNLAGVTGRNFIAMWNGSTWSTVGAINDLNNAVYAITIQDATHVYVGGLFTDLAGVTGRNKIAMWNGSAWSTVGAINDLNNAVQTIAIQDPTHVYVGGAFTNLAGVTGRSYIAMWNGSAWSTVGAVSDVNVDVYTIAIQDATHVYVGGFFTNLAGVTGRSYIAMWNGSAWSTVGAVSDLNNAVYDIAIQDATHVYVGGNFTNLAGVTGRNKIAMWNGSVWSTVGALSDVNAAVADIAIQDATHVYVVGNFTNLAGVTGRDKIGVWNGSAWSTLVSPGVSTITNDLTMTAGTLDNSNGSNDMTVNGTVTGTTGIINFTTNTFTQNVGAAKNFGTTSGSTAWMFNNLIFSSSTGSQTITTQTGGTGDITVNNVMTIAASTTLDAGNRTWHIQGTGTPLLVGSITALNAYGTLTANTSTFSFEETTGTIVIASATYYNLQTSPASGTVTYTLGTTYLSTGPTPCFLAGTKVLVNQGETQNIEDLKVGDSVLSYNMNTHQPVLSNITEISNSSVDYYYLINGKVKATGNHVFILADYSQKKVEDLKVGDLLATYIGTEAIETIERIDQRVTVYNIEVEGYHLYYADGYLVHNPTVINPITVSNNFTLTGAGTGTVNIDTIDPDLTVNSNVSIGSGQTLVASSFNGFNVKGNWTNAGTFTAGTGSIRFNGTTTGHTINTGGTGAGKDFYNLYFNGPGGAWSPLTNTVTVTNDLALDAGTLDNATGTADVVVNGTVYGTAGIINMTAGTFTQRIGAASKTFGTASGSTNWTFNNLNFENSSAGDLSVTTRATGTGQIIVGGTLTVGNDTDSNKTTLDNETNDRIIDANGDVNITSKGALSASSTGAFNVAGNWTNSGTFTANSGTVTFKGTTATTFTGSTTFNNLVMNSTTDGAKTITFPTGAGSKQVVSGTWTLDGAVGKVLTLVSASPATAWYFQVGAGFTAGDYINVTDSWSNNAFKITPGANTTNGGNNSGWLFGGSNTAPNVSSSLVQKKVTGGATITTGDWTNETQVQFTATASDTDNPDTLYLCVEKDVVATVFSSTNGGDLCGTGVAYSGTPVTVSVTITGLTDTAQYHWQAQVKDEAAEFSSFVTYGSNTENPPTNPAARDFGIDTTAPTGGTIFDGINGIDDAYNNSSLSALSAYWTSDEPTFDVSGIPAINVYQYAIGTTSGGTDTQTWTATGTSSTDSFVDVTGLTLRTGQTYYFSVKATDAAGNISTPINSNGQAVAPTLTFAYASGGTITFNELNSGNSWTDSSKTTVLQTSTNAYSGYVIKARALDKLRHTGSISNYIDHYIDPNSAPTTWSGIGFGYTTSDSDLSGGTANRFTNGGAKYAGWTETGPGDPVADHTANVTGTPISNEQFTITYRVTGDSLTPAGKYSTTIVYTCIPQY